ncbi:MAG: hypothetical protein ACREGH_02985 [Minisyncoccia bacterium]
MPNIELHGYGRQADSMKRKVRLALRDHPDAKSGEIITTTYSTKVEDFKDKKMPFLRIVATFKELPDLLERLRPLNEDMEVMLLRQWIPKQTS